MRQSLLSRFARGSKRQGQVGQTIVIMAFGFIVLLAFVGIVTDVSLMFVRYTTLRRAVDAAAVAAAGQVRRTLPNDSEKAKAIALGHPEYANGYAFARNLANINLAARQFIEFYGLSPSNVSVDSCDTLLSNPAPADSEKALMVLLECTNADQPRKLVRVTAQLQSPTVFLRLIGWGTVTLEASSISETAVLDVVLIFDTAETMLKQTTYNDWAKVPVVPDPSTGLVTYKADGTQQTKDQSLRYLPVRVKFAPNWNDGNAGLGYYWSATKTAPEPWVAVWKQLLGMTQNQIYGDTANFPEVAFKWDGTNATLATASEIANNSPRKDCRVRFFPYAETVGPNALIWQTTNGVTVPNDLMKSYDAILKTHGINTSFGANTPRFDGFIPTYDYFGCCNDPNGDNYFDDLICQPFKKVRDATEGFLDRIDFVRGDRVAFVTFDRTAYLIDPDGEKITDPVRGSQTPMMTSQTDAVTALRHIVGVRAEPYYYADTADKDGIAKTDGLWDAFVTGASAFTGTMNHGTPIRPLQRFIYTSETTGTWVDNVTSPLPDKGAGFNNTPLGSLNDYQVRYSCYWQNATLAYPFSIYSSQASLADRSYYGFSGYLYDNTPTDSPPGTGRVNEERWPTPLSAMNGPNNGKTPVMNPNLNLTAWNNSIKAAISDTPYGIQSASKPLFSYEFRAGCAGNNIGAALREGNNALLDPRTVRLGNAGAVWVMVLLGDGAAGASDPVVRNNTVIPGGDPYGANFASAPKVGQYGAYGLCPFGTPEDQMGLTTGWKTRPPRCSDDGSELSNGGTRGILGAVSRHFCQGSAVGDETKSAIDIGVAGDNTADCSTKYDVDDYARDWADFVGLTDLPTVSPFSRLSGVSSSRSLLQLPTIFTIGFGLDFTEPYVASLGPCSNSNGGPLPTPDEYTNINDCLGEELLRYIADVGDNNRVDTDYQQDYLNDGVINGVISSDPTKNLYGDRGPCEAPLPGGYANADVAPAGVISANNYEILKKNPLAPKTPNCGNYYNAPGGPELTKVFEDIASRMFTRITK